MPRIFRTGLLALLLIGPVLVLFLLHRGKNIYVQLPYFGSRTLDSKGDTVYHTVPPFYLNDASINDFNSRSLAGKVYVAEFFSIHSASLESTMTRNLRRVYEAFHTEKSFAIVSMSVDSAANQQDVLRQFRQKNQIMGNQWSLLYGNSGYISSLMGERGYLLKQNGASTADNLLQHGEYVSLVDKAGHIRGQYNATDEKEVERLMDEIRLLYINYANAESERKTAQ